LELLRARTAARLGFRSVQAWHDATTDDERNEMLALALLDGWGEEWQEIASAIHNSVCTKVEHLKTADDCRRFKQLERPEKKTRKDWKAVEAAFTSIIMSPKHGRK
jgi:hypothetical protein